MQKIITPLEVEAPPRGGIRHKTAWLRYLKEGIVPVAVKALPEGIRKAVRRPENAPRGEKILHLDTHSQFTLYVDGKAHRPEEALERLVVASNPQSIYNQVPIRGGKESLDMLRINDQEHIDCIELKPWASKDNPLFAIVELLKNLEIIRLLSEQGRGLKKQDRGEIPALDMSLTLLAPIEYYQSYILLDGTGQPNDEAVRRTNDLLAQLSSDFEIPISFYALDYPLSSFQKLCLGLAPKRSVDNKADVAGLEPISPLKHDRWKLVATS